MKACFKVTPLVKINAVKVNVHLYCERGIPVIALMKDNDESGEFETLKDIPLSSLVKEFLSTQDNMKELLGGALVLDGIASDFRKLAARLKRDGYTE